MKKKKHLLLNLRWMLKILVLLLLATGLILAHRSLTSYQDAIEQQQRDSTKSVNSSYAQTQLNTELIKYKPQIDEITNQAVTSQSELVSLLEQIETEGKVLGIFVQVPDLTPKREIDKNGQNTMSLIEDIEITIIANGQPNNLITFLHRAENIPYAVLIDSWNLKTRSNTVFRDQNDEALNLAELELTLLLPVVNQN